MNTTKILGEAVGIQRQDIIDQTEEQLADSLNGAAILGRFKRGRLDKTMTIHQGNIRGQLGYEPKNPDYIAVQDCLDAGVPSVQVLRMKSRAKTDVLPMISCADATAEAILTGDAVIDGWTIPVTVDIYVNGNLVAEDITATYINQYWTSNELLLANKTGLNYSVYGDSSRNETFFNDSDENITFSFVPRRDGKLMGVTYPAKDALRISPQNTNPTAYKDSESGIVTFCLAPHRAA